MNGASTAEIEDRQFAELLERAPREAEKFSAAVGPWLDRSLERFFPALLNAIDHAPAEIGPMAAELIRSRYRAKAPELLLPLLGEGGALRFNWAAGILVDLRVEAAVPPLCRILDRHEKNLVLPAIRYLAALQTKPAIHALQEYLLNHPDEVQLSAAFRYLLPLVDKLGALLLDKLNSMTGERRAWVIKFLAEAGYPPALEVFRNALVADPLDLGHFAISGLGKIGSVQAVAVLIQHGISQKEWFLRKRTVDALGQCAVPEAIAPLIDALTDGSVQVRTAAVESLSKVGHRDLEQLISSLLKSGQERKIGLIRALGQIRDKRNVEPLVRTLQDRSTLFFSLDAIGDLGFVEASSALVPFLKDGEWFNRLNALEALAKMNAPGLRDLAHDCLEDPNDMVRNAAQRILSKKEPTGIS